MAKELENNMQAGNTSSIQYKHWSGQDWSASLQGVSRENVGGIIDLPGVIDPDFEHVGPYPANNYNHEDKWIQYITGDGTFWSCVCHSHSQSLDVAFTFEHFPKDSDDSHESDHIELLDWEGKCWEVYANNIPLPGDDPIPVIFHVVPKP